jgi:hypothetical protein
MSSPHARGMNPTRAWAHPEIYPNRATSPSRACALSVARYQACKQSRCLAKAIALSATSRPCRRRSLRWTRRRPLRWRAELHQASLTREIAAQEEKEITGALIGDVIEARSLGSGSYWGRCRGSMIGIRRTKATSVSGSVSSAALCALVSDNRGRHSLVSHPGEGGDLSLEGKCLGRHRAVLQGVTVALGSPASGPTHPTDASPLRSCVASGRLVHS